MKKLFILFGIILFCVKLTAPPINEVKLFVIPPIQPYERLWEAMCFVESSFNPLVVNEAEQAYGLVQIRQVKLDWYFDKTGKLYTLQDCFNESVAKEIWNYHMSLYPNAETGARAWNGRYDLTHDYWNKVQNYLNYKL